MEFCLHVCHRLGVSRGDSCDALVSLLDILLKRGLVVLQSLTVLGHVDLQSLTVLGCVDLQSLMVLSLADLHSLQETRHTGRHCEMGSLVELHKSNRFGHKAARIPANEGDVPADV